MELVGSLPHLQGSTTGPYPSQINSFLCPSHFSEARLVSFLVGLKTYQHPDSEVSLGVWIDNSKLWKVYIIISIIIVVVVIKTMAFLRVSHSGLHTTKCKLLFACPSLNWSSQELSSYKLPILKKTISFPCFPIISSTSFTFICIYVTFVSIIFLWYQNLFCSMVERSLSVVQNTHMCFL